MKKKGIGKLSESYSMGITKFYDFLDWCSRLGVNEVTVYALSTENITGRGGFEIETLGRVFTSQAVSALDDKRLTENGIKVNVCGDRELLKKMGNPIGVKLVNSLDRLEEKTRDNKRMTLNLALGYGGRQEILDAAKKTMESGKELSEENIRENLWVKSYPDLIIRTSESRLSNFLTWQSAYSEIYFIDKLWQEFSERDLEQVVKDFNQRERRFGT